MEQVQQGARGLALIFTLNGDRLLYVATVVAALGLGAFLGTVLF